MRILFTGGGTGGHIFPILAIFRSLKNRLPKETEYYFVGPKTDGLETLTQEGIRVYAIIAGKLPRYITARIVVELIKITTGMVLAIIALWRTMPDIVFGKGGYGTVPIVLAARLFGIPVIIHESDAIPGVATRIAARFASAIAISFTDTLAWFPKARITGNPVRVTIKQGSRPQAQARWHIALGEVILVLGGSQGAWQLNQTILEAAPTLLEKTEIILQCGAKTHHTTLELARRILQKTPHLATLLHIDKFLDEKELADAYAISSLVVSRAGSGTLYENALAAKPMLLIPLESAAANHQKVNAAIFAKAGGAEIITQENLAPHLFSKKILTLLQNRPKLHQMSQIVQHLALPNAADDVASMIIENIPKALS